MTAYYNEHDPEKAAWIRELIKAQVVAPGDVDERSIVDVRADDLKGYVQCHFFAGIAVWSYSLRLAGWPDDKPCWTGSCPCPSFSCAGKGEGFDDPRHLWPYWYPLICECCPRTIFGEQADDAIGFGWLDLVSGDLEAAGYAIAAAVLGAHSVGAPHIRQRLYFCADSETAEVLARSGEVRTRTGTQPSNRSRNGGLLGVGSNSEHDGCDRPVGTAAVTHRNQQKIGISDRDCRELRHSSQRGFAMRRRSQGKLRLAAFPNETGIGSESERARLEGFSGHVREWRGPGWLDPHTTRSVAASGATRGFWADCDWWHARDGKYRPIEPGLFPLVNGATNRVLKLRGYGDAIVAEVAKAFIEAYLDTRSGVAA